MAGEMMAPAAPAAAPEAAAPAEYTITLNVSGGKITVASSMAAVEGEEPAGAPAASIKDAVSMVMAIYANDGEMPEADTSEEDFQAGFGKPQKSPMIDKRRDVEEMG